VFAAACGTKAEKPASRQEALAVCLDGCMKKVEQAGPPSDEQRRSCNQTCGCIIDEMFHANGERRKDAKPLSAVGAACGAVGADIDPVIRRDSDRRARWRVLPPVPGPIP
jgi:hypothetical protein